MAVEAGADQRLLAMGVDGAPGGWVAATCCGEQLSADPTARRTELHFFEDIRALAHRRAGKPGGEQA